MDDLPRRHSVTVTTRTLLVAALVVGLGYMVATVADAILLLFVGVFLGLVAEGPTRLLMRHTRLGRGLAGTIVVLGSTITITVLALILLVPMVRSVIDLLHDLPQIVAEVQDNLPSSVGNSGAAGNVSDGAASVSARVPDGVSSALGLAGEFFSIGLAAFTLIFVALFFISDAPRLQKALASILPGSDADRAVMLWERITETVTRWAVGALTIALIAGTLQGTTAWLLGSEYALALGIIAGLLDLIPNIGATLAGFVLTIVLFAEQGTTAAIIMLVVVLVYQQLENNILSPTIYGKAVNISGLFVISGVTLMGALLGVVGALIAVPVTASLQIIVQEYTKDRRERLAAQRVAIDTGPSAAS